MLDFLSNTDLWSIIIKCLLTTFLSLGIGALCTLTGKLIIKSKHSKLARHAKIAVAAAEMKFPNEGTKMGPEKMTYVMDYLAVMFPKIKSNQYLYNIAEAAVYELNEEKRKKEALQQFKDKYGELPCDLTNANEDLNSADIAESTEQDAAKTSVESVNTQTNVTDFNLKSF